MLLRRPALAFPLLFGEPPCGGFVPTAPPALAAMAAPAQSPAEWLAAGLAEAEQAVGGGSDPEERRAVIVGRWVYWRVGWFWRQHANGWVEWTRQGGWSQGEGAHI